MLLCILIYTRTGCGLRTTVKILGIFEEVLEGACGEAPSYNSVSNWFKKLGLSIYEEDHPVNSKYAIIMDESITINREKLLLTLAVPAEHKGRPTNHADVKVVGIQVGKSFTKDDVSEEVKRVGRNVGWLPDYAISDQGHNLVAGIAAAEIPAHRDISHALGNCMKHVYGEEDDFKELTTKLGKIRLQYHLTDKAWLLPPNMRTIARFMNLECWVTWATKMLGCYGNLDDRMKEAYAFLLDYQDLIGELDVCIKAIRHLEVLCKTKGYCRDTHFECMHYILRNVIGNANSRRAKLGLEMMDYFLKESILIKKLPDYAHNISSDIIESDFGVYKDKHSKNNLSGVTSSVLILPLYPVISDYSTAKAQDFKVRLANVKLREIEAWAKSHLSPNWAIERSKMLNNVG